MTHIAGIQTGRSVVLIADSAATGGIRAFEREVTSVGETNQAHEVTRQYVEERMVKIYSFDNFAFATAGRTSVVRQFFHSLHHIRQLEPGKTIASSLQSALEKTGPSAGQLDIVVAISAPDGAYMLRLDAASPQLGFSKVDASIVQAGSPPQALADCTRQIAERLVFGGISARYVLPAITGCAMSFNTFNPSMSKGVGGVYHAMLISSTGLEWQDPTLYLFVNREYHIDGSLWTAGCELYRAWSSSATRDIRVVAQEKPPLPHRAWRAMRKLARLPIQFIVILSVYKPRLAILPTNGNREGTHFYFGFSPIGCHNPELSMTLDVVNYLFDDNTKDLCDATPVDMKFFEYGPSLGRWGQKSATRFKRIYRRDRPRLRKQPPPH